MNRRRRPTRAMPRPFLKWAGGKRSLLPEILERLPKRKIKTYIEPFVGGGALFFALAREGRFETAVLGDRNGELVSTYTQVRDAVGDVLEAIQQWRFGDKEAYYEVRNMDTSDLSATVRAARTLYLNRTCFNGLYRLNRSGKFNVPFGDNRAKGIVDEENLVACSKALADVQIISASFEETMAGAGEGDFVYCDPPYWPVSKTANFTSYDQLPFGPEEHAALNAEFRTLAARGARGLLSNSKVPETTELYEGLRKSTVFVRRPINRDGAKRGAVPEYLVRSR